MSGVARPGAALEEAPMLPDKRTILEIEGYVVAFRTWRVGPTGLLSVNPHSIRDYPDPWRPGKKAVSEHQGSSFQHLPGSCPEGACGIYAYKYAWGSQLGDYPGGVFIHGTVRLWGDVVEYTEGYRAQYAYPDRMVDTGPVARFLADLYDVLIMEVSEWEELARRFGG